MITIIIGVLLIAASLVNLFFFERIYKRKGTSEKLLRLWKFIWVVVFFAGLFFIML